MDLQQFLCWTIFQHWSLNPNKLHLIKDFKGFFLGFWSVALMYREHEEWEGKLCDKNDREIAVVTKHWEPDELTNIGQIVIFGIQSIYRTDYQVVLCDKVWPSTNVSSLNLSSNCPKSAVLIYWSVSTKASNSSMFFSYTANFSGSESCRQKNKIQSCQWFLKCSF